MRKPVPEHNADADTRALVPAISSLRAAAKRIDTRAVRGRITRAIGTLVHAVLPDTRIGELCLLEDPRTGLSLEAEVIGLSGDGVLLTP
ncbi:MAG: EscN/YscN/HrcN family type III secretion system ATPase, partial [Mesorhizobium sp.]